VFIGARGVARAMLTEMNGPELERIRSDHDAEYIYTHLIDYYKESLYGGWIYHKRGLRKKNADGTKTWPPIQCTKLVPSALYHSPLSGSSKVSPISAERHLITTFHLRIRHFPKIPTLPTVPTVPRRTLQVSVDRRGIDTGASTSRGPHQPSTTPASASASASSSKNAVTASRHNKRKCTTPPNDPHTNPIQSKTQRLNLRCSCRKQGSSSDKDKVIDVKSDSEEQEQDEVRKNNHSNKLIDQIS
jgi:hypothetical protein